MKKTLISIAFVALLSACVATTGSKAPSADAGANPDYDSNGKPRAVKVTQTQRGVQITSDERVLFDTGKSEIKPDGSIYIERIATVLKTKTQAQAVIEGHTDDVGGAQLNQQLSVRRANAVRDALIKQGVPAARMQAQGFGLTRPVADNKTPEGRQTNRRTEIHVLGESVERIAGQGGAESMADSLSAGIDRFLKDSVNFLKNVFGAEQK
jgi:outer membrane protein OmpA-like peptidoglycan-associated protein